MTLAELAELLQFIGLIVIYLLSLTLFIIAMVRISRKGLNRQSLVFLIISLGAVFTAYLAYNVREISPANWAQILLTFGLVAVTGFYALSAYRQADASVEMAKEMREQTKTLKDTFSMSVRPSVSIDIERFVPQNNHPFEPPRAFTLRLQNTGKGAARNLEITGEAQGKTVEYSKIEIPSLNVGEEKRISISSLTDASTNEIRAAYVVLKAIYNDDLGESWFTKLEINKEEQSWKSGEITSGKLSEEKD